MTGRTIDRMYPEAPAVAADADAGARGRATCAATRLDGVSFTLRRGEILGVGGLAGQGQRELFMTLFGARRSTRRRGRASAAGARRMRKPGDAIRHADRDRARPRGPQDRGADAADVGPRQPDARHPRPRLARRRVSTRGASAAPSRRAIERLQIKTRRPSVQEVGTLSGGNQQKVLIGRWLLAELGRPAPLRHHARRRRRHEARHLRADHGARRARASRSSSTPRETEEIARLCHRVLVMREGRVAAELAGGTTDAEAIVAAALQGARCPRERRREAGRSRTAAAAGCSTSRSSRRRSCSR